MSSAVDSGGVGTAMSEPSLLWAFLGITGLSTTVLAQPVYEVLAQSPEYFVVRRSSAILVVLFALGLLVPGVILGFLVGLIGTRSIPARRTAMGCTVAVLVGVFALQLCVRADLTGGWPLVVGSGAAVAAGLGVLRVGGFRWFVSLLGLAPPIFLLAFLIEMPLVELSAPPPTITAPIQLENTIVFVVFDEFPTASLLEADGSIDSSRYPNFARLSSTSTWYRHAVTVDVHTPNAVPAIVSGSRSAGRLPHYSQYEETLFTVLGSPDSVIREPFTNLCPPNICRNSTSTLVESSHPPLFEIALEIWLAATVQTQERYSLDPFSEVEGVYLGHGDPMLARLNASTRIGPSEAFEEFVNSMRPNTLNFIHSLLPHGPYRYYSDGIQYNDFEILDGFEAGSWSNSEAWPALARQRHMLQAGHVDFLLGSLLDRLESEGWLDDTLLVVVADHGIAFEAGESLRGPQDAFAAEVGMVPLFIKVPGQRLGRVDPRAVLTIDVLPTIADALGVNLRLSTGHSLLDEHYDASEKEQPPNIQHLVQHPNEELSLIAAEWATLFPRRGPDGLLAPRWSDGWIGKSLADLAVVSDAAGPKANVQSEQLLLNVSRSSGFIPGLIRGEVELASTHSEVAIVEEGIVLAVAPIISDGRHQGEFAALVEPALLADGPHRLELYALGPSRRKAIRLNYDGPLIFEVKTNLRGLVDTNGREYKFVSNEGSLRGSVESVDWNPLHIASQSMYMIGWVLDTDDDVQADLIVIFVDGHFAGYSNPAIDLRSQVAELTGSEVTNNGFVVNVPYALEGSELAVQVYALFGDSAFELPLSDTVQARLKGLRLGP